VVVVFLINAVSLVQKDFLTGLNILLLSQSHEELLHLSCDRQIANNSDDVIPDSGRSSVPEHGQDSRKHVWANQLLQNVFAGRTADVKEGTQRDFGHFFEVPISY